MTEVLMNGYYYDRVLADKSYDVDNILQHIAEKGVEAFIPPRGNRK